MVRRTTLGDGCLSWRTCCFLRSFFICLISCKTLELLEQQHWAVYYSVSSHGFHFVLFGFVCLISVICSSSGHLLCQVTSFNDVTSLPPSSCWRTNTIGESGIWICSPLVWSVGCKVVSVRISMSVPFFLFLLQLSVFFFVHFKRHRLKVSGSCYHSSCDTTFSAHFSGQKSHIGRLNCHSDIQYTLFCLFASGDIDSNRADLTKSVTLTTLLTFFKLTPWTVLLPWQ